jgi:hypothetical protein
MRLNELADPADYIPTQADLTGFLEDIEGLWPDHIDVPCRTKPQVEKQIFDAISGMQCLNRQWR